MDLTGVYPPIPTPFSPETGAINLQALKSNTDRWLTSRLRGLVLLGSNGEAPLVDEVESDRLIDTVRARVPTTRRVLAGTGRESTRATVDASRRAAALPVNVYGILLWMHGGRSALMIPCALTGGGHDTRFARIFACTARVCSRMRTGIHRAFLHAF